MQTSSQRLNKRSAHPEGERVKDWALSRGKDEAISQGQRNGAESLAIVKGQAQGLSLRLDHFGLSRGNPLWLPWYS
jgi:hypothetical protein